MDTSLSASRGALNTSSSTFDEPVVKIHLTPRADASAQGCSKSYTLKLTPGIPGIIGRASRSGKLQEESPARAYIDSPVVSRNHSSIIVLRKDEGKPSPYISDVKSMHGTYLNGNKLEPFEETKMSDGDTVSFGATVNRGDETFHPPHFLINIENASKQAPSNFTYGVPECTSSEIDLDEVDDEPVITKAPNGTRKNPFEVPDESLDHVVETTTKPVIIKIPDSSREESVNDEASSLADKAVEVRLTKDSFRLKSTHHQVGVPSFSSEDLGDSDYDENAGDDAELRETNDESLAVRIDDNLDSDDQSNSFDGYDSDVQSSSHYSDPNSDIDRASVDYPEREGSISESAGSLSSMEESQNPVEKHDLNDDSSESDLDRLELEHESDFSDGVDDTEEQEMPVSIKEVVTSGTPALTTQPIVPTTSEFLAARGPGIPNMAKGKEVEKTDPLPMAEFGSMYPFSTQFWSAYEWPSTANPSQPYTQGPFIGGGSTVQPSSFDDYVTFAPREPRIQEYIPPANAAPSHLDSLIERHRSKQHQLHNSYIHTETSYNVPNDQANSGSQEIAQDTKQICQNSAVDENSRGAAPDPIDQAMSFLPSKSVETSPSANQKAKGISIQDIVHAAPPGSESTSSCDLSRSGFRYSEPFSARGTKRKADEFEEDEASIDDAPHPTTTEMVTEPAVTAQPSSAEVPQENLHSTPSTRVPHPSKKARTLKYAAGFLAGAVATFAALVIPPEGFYD